MSCCRLQSRVLTAVPLLLPLIFFSTRQALSLLPLSLSKISINRHHNLLFLHHFSLKFSKNFSLFLPFLKISLFLTRNSTSSSLYSSFQLHLPPFIIILYSSFKLHSILSPSSFLHFITIKHPLFFYFSSFHTPFPSFLRIFLLTSLHNSYETLKEAKEHSRRRYIEPSTIADLKDIHHH